MVERCPECGAPAADAPWCGTCGARLEGVVDVPAVDADGTLASAADRPSRPLFVVAAVAAIALLAAVTLGGPDPSTVDDQVAAPTADEGVPPDADAVVPPTLPSPAVVNRQFPSTASELWVRRDVPLAESSPAIEAAGALHVRIGDRLVRTTAGPPSLWALPEEVGAVRRDGRWGAVDFGRLVVGDLDGGAPRVVPTGTDWVPTGPVLAWGPFPVLRGTDGTIAAVGEDGLAWRTSALMAPGGAVSDRWLAATREDGSHVAIDLSTGGVVDLPTRPLAFVDDLALLGEDEVVALDLGTGAERWRRARAGVEWVVSGATLVELGAGAATRVDPMTGEDRGSVTGFVPVPAGDVAVVQEPGRLVATGFDGVERWTLPLEGQGTHAVVGIDEGRVAVRSDTPAGPRVTVLAAEDGAVLAVEAVVPDGAGLVEGDGVVAVLGSVGDVVVDLATGEDVDAPVPAPAAADLTFTSAADEFRVEAGTVLLRAVDADGSVRWTADLGAPVSVGPERTGTSLVVGLADGRVAVVDPSTGEPRWERDVVTLPTAVAGNGAVLLAGTADGEVLRFDPSGNPVTSIDLGGDPVLSLVPGRPAVALLPGRLVGIDVTP